MDSIGSNNSQSRRVALSQQKRRKSIQAQRAGTRSSGRPDAMHQRPRTVVLSAFPRREPRKPSALRDVLPCSVTPASTPALTVSRPYSHHKSRSFRSRLRFYPVSGLHHDDAASVIDSDRALAPYADNTPMERWAFLRTSTRPHMLTGERP